MMHEYISAAGLRSTVWNMDCMELMRGKEDGYWDLAVVDPPYGIGFDGESNSMVTSKGIMKKKPIAKGYIRKDWDNKPTDEYFNELLRVSKKQIIWGGNYFNLPVSGGWIVWDKKRPHNFTLSQAELAWVSFTGSIKIFYYLWHGMFKQSPEIRTHPTQKPTALYDWIYRNYLPNGGKVLDSHLGSGSNRISAFKRGNIIFDSTELDADYFATGNARFDAFTAKYEPATHISADATGQTKIF